MVATRTRSLPVPVPVPSTPDSAADAYETMRQARIRENLARMEKLGILSLSHQLNKPRPTPRRNLTPASAPSPALHPSRRSSRIQNSTPVSYAEVPVKEERGKRGIVVVEGEREEVYTDEHERLLGECGAQWELFVDGCGADGKRVYDQVRGKTCHQCRQKTLGHRTNCSNCNIVQGQFCGDCLYMRYGENVLEANNNPDWICPPCRGICNCSICRIKKGWAPTGALYKKVLNLGFKSVAHYLIQTRRRQPKDSGDENIVRSSSKKSLCFSDSADHIENGVNPAPTVEKNTERNEEGSKNTDEHSVTDVLTPLKLKSVSDVRTPLKRKSEVVNGQKPDTTALPSPDSIGARVRNRRNKE